MTILVGTNGTIAGTHFIDNNHTWGTRFTASASGTATQAQVYRGGGSAGPVVVAVYDSSENLIAQSSATSLSSASNWNVVPISVAITSGQVYRLAAIANAFMNWGYVAAGGSFNGEADNGSTYPNPADPFTADSSDDGDFSIYLEDSGGGAAAPKRLLLLGVG